MDVTLYVGDYAYSSWSLRGWLLLDAFGIGFTLRHAHMRSPAFEELRAEMAPSHLVPAVAINHAVGAPVVVWDTMAIAETMHDYHLGAGIWPKGERVRPVARSLAAEMHSGFSALRAACPMNMRVRYAGFVPDAGVLADLARLEMLWAHGASRKTGAGPYLFGDFSAVDAFFAPVASRIVTYDLPMGEAGMTYVRALLAHPSVRRWRAMAWADPHVQPQYAFDLEQQADPLVPDLVGTVVAEGVAENGFCPFTAEAPVYLVRIGDRLLGFGDAFTQVKVAADPAAWPELASYLS